MRVRFSNNALVVWTIVAITALIVLLPAKCQAQQVVCNRQPMSGLEYKDNGKKYEAAEWHCTGTEQQAFALLSQSNVGPFTPATTLRFAENTNRASFREKLLRGAQLASMFVGPLTALNISEPVWRAVIGGAPMVAQMITEIGGGLPKEFEATQSSGYAVVYSMASNQNRVVQNAPLGLMRLEPTEQMQRQAVETINKWVVKTVEFQPTDWYTLYHESQVRGNEVLERWRIADIHWSMQWNREVNQNFFMNEAEAVAYMRNATGLLVASR